jgi:pyridoxine 5-phosphate synthase
MCREIHELNIGHSIISRAVLSGLKNAVKDMKDIIRKAYASGDNI